MKKEIRILYLEDLPADVVMVNHELRRGGMAFRTKRVDSKEGFLHELERDPPDLILSDHGLPSFDGFSALAIARDKCPEVPFIFVTTLLGEEMTIETFEGGATDYILKNNLRKLVPAVRRALREAEERATLKQKEQALRESEERFRTLVEGVKDYAIFLLDTRGRVTSWNCGAQWLHGYASEEVNGQHFSIFYTLEDQARRQPEIGLKTAALEGRFEEEGLRVCKSGKTFWANVVITALRDTTGKLRGYAQVIRNITQQVLAREELQKSEQRSRRLLELLPDAVLVVHPEGQIAFCNTAAEKMLRAGGPAQLLGRSFRDLFPPEDGHRALEVIRNLRERGPATPFVQEELVRLDGTRLVVEMSATPLIFQDKPAMQVVAHDITERIRDGTETKQGEPDLRPSDHRVTTPKEAEEEIQRLKGELEQRVVERTRQLEAANEELEAFSSSVSHDLRVPLRHIATCVQLLQTQNTLHLDKASKQQLQRIADSVEHLRKLIDALLAFSRMGRAELRLLPVSLEALVEEARQELRREIEGRDIDWRIGKLPEVRGDPFMLRQVIVNLLSNALKYTRTRPQAKIEISGRDTGQETVFSVRDNGIGFDMQSADKLFGVFQRLHPPVEFEGVGIGLANVRRIIHRHGGRAWAEGSVDGGATFYFSIPHAEAEA